MSLAIVKQFNIKSRINNKYKLTWHLASSPSFSSSRTRPYWADWIFSELVWSSSWVRRTTSWRRVSSSCCRGLVMLLLSATQHLDNMSACKCGADIEDKVCGLRKLTTLRPQIFAYSGDELKLLTVWSESCWPAVTALHPTLYTEVSTGNKRLLSSPSTLSWPLPGLYINGVTWRCDDTEDR